MQFKMFVNQQTLKFIPTKAMQEIHILSLSVSQTLTIDDLHICTLHQQYQKHFLLFRLMHTIINL